MKKLSSAIIFTLMAFFATTAPALANANQAYTCDSATKVIRDYKGNPQAWKNRGLYERSRQATVYFNAHCTGANSGHAANANLAVNQGPIRPATCKDCFDAGYRKGVQVGQLAAINAGPRASSVTNPMTANASHHTATPARTVYVSHQPKKAIVQHGNHSHHSEAEKLDCALTDALNRRSGPVVKVVKHIH